jgi:hypothetical protein
MAARCRPGAHRAKVPITVQRNPFIGTEPKGNPAFRDLDGDGDLDFALGANGGPPPARGQIPITVQGNPFAALDAGRDSAPAFMDVDGDGRADLVLGAADGTVEVWSARGNIPITVNGNPFAAIDVGGTASPPSWISTVTATSTSSSARGTGRCGAGATTAAPSPR